MKNKIYKILNPNDFIIYTGVIFIIISLIYLIVFNKFGSPFSYALYLLMSYSLTIFCIKVYKMLKKRINNIIDNNKYLKKYKNDINLRHKFSLFISVILNTIYALLKLISGIIYNSIWLIAFAIYYMLLIFIKMDIIKEELKNIKSLEKEYLKYRKVGIILLLLNVILIFIILIIVNQKIIIKYPEFIAIAIACFTFYILISSFVNLIKYRKYNSPLINASKIINVITSLISLLSLELVLISCFGENNTIIFKEVMIMSTGGGISIIIIIISLYMIIKSTEWLNNK